MTLVGWSSVRVDIRVWCVRRSCLFRLHLCVMIRVMVRASMIMWFISKRLVLIVGSWGNITFHGMVRGRRVRSWSYRFMILFMIVPFSCVVLIVTAVNGHSFGDVDWVNVWHITYILLHFGIPLWSLMWHTLYPKYATTVSTLNCHALMWWDAQRERIL